MDNVILEFKSARSRSPRSHAIESLYHQIQSYTLACPPPTLPRPQMDDRYRPRDPHRHPGSAPPTPYYRDRYPGRSPDKGRRFDSRDRPREWERERERYPLEETGFYRSSSAGYTREDVGGPSSVSRRFAPEPRRDPERFAERAGGLAERGRVRSYNADDRVRSDE